VWEKAKKKSTKGVTGFLLKTREKGKKNDYIKKTVEDLKTFMRMVFPAMIPLQGPCPTEGKGAHLPRVKKMVPGKKYEGKTDLSEPD